MKNGSSYFLCIPLLFCTLLLPSLLYGLEVPPLKARVNDLANMLSEGTVHQLENSLATFEQNQSTQIVILTIDSLQGEVLEEYSLRVVEKWKPGQAGLDNGALLLIAKNDRKVRIEVGYGLEGSLTDLTAGRIIRNTIVPRFKKGNFDQGVIDGVSAMMQTVSGEFLSEDLKNQKKLSKNSFLEEYPDPIGFLFLLLMILIFIGRSLGKNRLKASLIGGGSASLFGLLAMGPKWMMISFLFPVGVICTYITSLFHRSRTSKSLFRTHHRHNHWGGYGGGFGGGSFGGGFGGGGGGFGGGGASGGW